MSVLLFGVSHRSAPVSVLEQLSTDESDQAKIVDQVLQSPLVTEAMVLATCNRVEVYAVVDAFHGGLSAIGQVLAEHSGMSMGDLTKHAYVRYSEAAVEHLFAVASGLDSAVIGEQQVLGQVRRAYASAEANQTVGRVLRRRDEPGVRRRTFVHAGSTTAKLRLPRRAGFEAYVRRTLEREGVGTGGRPVVFWTFPTNADLPGLIDAFDPEVVVADVVDDNRTWYDPGSPGWDRTEANYREVLRRSDVVLANCEPVAAAMAAFTPDVHVVPNGLELPAAGAAGRRGPRPAALAGIDGPVLAYVGNLSARIDIGLLESVVAARPEWTLVLVGSAHLDRSILELDRLPNVRFLGVTPYAEVRRLLEHVDVGLIPHVDNEMTRAMNPLKAFVYASAGVPIVATPVANLAELGDLLTVAEGAEAFVGAIEALLAAGRPNLDLEVLAPHSWDERVRVALDLVDDAMGGRAASPSAVAG